jgi:hypothetical protein
MTSPASPDQSPITALVISTIFKPRAAAPKLYLTVAVGERDIVPVDIVLELRFAGKKRQGLGRASRNRWVIFVLQNLSPLTLMFVKASLKTKPMARQSVQASRNHDSSTDNLGIREPKGGVYKVFEPIGPIRSASIADAATGAKRTARRVDYKNHTKTAAALECMQTRGAKLVSGRLDVQRARSKKKRDAGLQEKEKEQERKKEKQQAIATRTCPETTKTHPTDTDSVSPSSLNTEKGSRMGEVSRESSGWLKLGQKS